jgi:hypothetical protein
MPDLDSILDQAMALPYETRLDFIEIIKKRTVSEERDKIALQAREALQDYACGNIRTGNAEDLLKDLESDDE